MPLRTPKGKYRHRVSLIKISLGASGTAGTPARTETVIGTVWAAIRPLSGRELEDGSKQISETTHRVDFLYGSEWTTLNAHDIIRFVSRDFELVSLRNFDERNIELTAICKELV